MYQITQEYVVIQEVIMKATEDFLLLLLMLMSSLVETSFLIVNLSKMLKDLVATLSCFHPLLLWSMME